MFESELLNFFIRIEDKRLKEKGEFFYPYWDALLDGYTDDVTKMRKHINKCLLLSIIPAFIILSSILGDLITGILVLDIFMVILSIGVLAVTAIYCFFANSKNNIIKYIIGFLVPIIYVSIADAILALF